MKQLHAITPDTVRPIQEIQSSLGALVAARPALEKLANREWSMKAAYHIGKLLRLARVEWEAHEAKRHEAVKRYGEERTPTPAEEIQFGSPAPIQSVKAENLPAFISELSALNETIVTLQWSPFDLTPFNQQISISPIDLDSLLEAGLVKLDVD